MKNIYGILSNLEIEVPEEKKADLEKGLLENYKTIADYDKQTAKVVSLQEQLSAAKEGLKAFEGVDVNELKGRIAELQGDLAARDTEWQSKFLEMEFNGRIKDAIVAAKGRSVKAILGELGEDGLKSLRESKNQETDIKAALDALKKESGYLFEGEARNPAPPASGAAPRDGAQTLAGAIGAALNAQMKG